jgi:ligand-binding sensor domain-containing protein
MVYFVDSASVKSGPYIGTIAAAMRRLCVILLLLMSLLSKAQQPFNDDYFLFESSDAVRINAMVQDKIGYMWLGTELGLYRFNGQGDLTPIFDTVHSPVTSLFDAQDVVYVGYQSGVIGRVINDTVSIIALGEHVRGPIHSIRVSPTGLIFFGTSDGLFCAMSGAVRNVGKMAGLPDGPCYSLSLITGSTLAASIGGSIYAISLTRGKLNARRLKTGSSENDTVAVIRQVPHSGLIWSGGNGLARINTSNGHIGAFSQPWKWGRLADILIRSPNHVWVATETGFLLDVRLTDSFSVKPYYYGKHYTALLRSKSGNIWCGTDQGLSSVSAEFAMHLKLGTPYSMYGLTSMAIDRQNNLWFAEGQKLYRNPLKDSTHAPQLIASVPATITSLFVENKTVWIGTDSGLWYKADNATVTKVHIQTLEKKNITSIMRGGAQGHLWISGEGGIEELETGAGISLFKHHDKQSGLSSNDVYQVHPDRRGIIWIATDSGGLCSYDGSRYTCWDSVSGFNSKVVYSIAEDKWGNIWAGTPGNGLYRYNGKAWKRFGRENGLQDLSISALMGNSTGQMVIVNQAGVDEWYPRSVHFRHYNARTAPSIDSTSTTINCIAKDTDGNVYVASTKGLSVFTNVQTTLELRPYVHLNKISVLFKPVPYSQHIFSHKENHLSFQYEGINFVNIEKLNYRYRLEGYSDDWTFTNNEPVNFPQLAPGKYKFRLQASLDKDFEEATEVDYAFQIKSPVWKQPWFLVLSVGLMLALIYGYIKFREKNLKRLAALKQERMLFEYEHLKSQVNPHFLFNSLNTLTNLIEENQENAIEYTVQLSALYRNILTYRNKDTILLAEECKLLKSYLFIQRRRFGNALHCDSNIPQQVLDTCKIVPLALQLLVENAIKHNVVTANSPLHIYIGITEKQEIVVRNELKLKLSKEAGAGLGLQNIQRRYGLLTKRPVWHGVDGNDFVVKLPLL